MMYEEYSGFNIHAIKFYPKKMPNIKFGIAIKQSD